MTASPGSGPVVQDLSLEDLEALKRSLEERLASKDVSRWNPKQEDVEKAVVQLVLTLVEFLRELMERQAIRRMERGTLDDDDAERVGTGLMHLEDTVRDLAGRFGLTPEELQLDLGPLKLR